jgi:hypothetical protein
MRKQVSRSHALRGNARRDALRPVTIQDATQSVATLHSLAERGNEEGSVIPYQGDVTWNEEPVMAPAARLLLVLALLGGTLAASPGFAQTADGPGAADTATAGSAATPEPEFLKTFPRPPDQPASLLAPAPPLGPLPPDLEKPYFQQDALLDPPALGAIGWFANVDAGILKPHLVNQLRNTVTFPDGSSTTVGVDPSHLNWTVSPRIEVGYRLPSGFGGISVAYRNMTSQGSEGVIGADGPATLSSRLNVNLVDLDWVSKEYTPWSLWEMRCHFGLRYLNTYFDSQANEPFAGAAAGTTIFNQRTTDNVWGLGPHWSLDVRRQLGFGGLAISGFIDLSDNWGRLRQNYFASSTTSASGLPQAGQTSVATSVSVPALTARLGLNWQPPAYPNFRLFAGYQLDYWWNVGRIDNLLNDGFPTSGYFFDSGIVLRGEWNY